MKRGKTYRLRDDGDLLPESGETDFRDRAVTDFHRLEIGVLSVEVDMGVDVRPYAAEKCKQKRALKMDGGKIRVFGTKGYD